METRREKGDRKTPKSQEKKKKIFPSLCWSFWIMKKRDSPPFTSYQWVALSFGSVLSYAKVGSRGSSAEGSQEIARQGRGVESMLGTKAGGGTSLLLLSHLVVSVSLQTHGLPTACQATLSFTISWSLLILMSIELVMPSNHLVLSRAFSSCPQSFPASGSFPMSQLFTSGDQRIGASASASVFPMNTLD